MILTGKTEKKIKTKKKKESVDDITGKFKES